MEKRKLKKFKLKINPTKMGSFFNSLVKSPAIESNFIAFNDEIETIKFYFNTEERKITGPLMIPNKEILRKDKEGNYYEVFFSQEDINEIVMLFAKNNRFNSIKESHTNEIEGLVMIESWMVGSEGDKIYSDFGFTKEQIPTGTWMGTYYVEDDNLWEDIKNGKFKGFSVEGLFEMEEVFTRQEFVIEPEAGETKEIFLERCISKEATKYPHQQAIAICESKWERKEFESDVELMNKLDEIKNMEITDEEKYQLIKQLLN